MRRIALAMMVVCAYLSFLSPKNTFAAMSTNQPQTLPHTINNQTYTDVIVYWQDWLDRTIMFYFNPISTGDYGGQLRYTTDGIGGGNY